MDESTTRQHLSAPRIGLVAAAILVACTIITTPTESTAAEGHVWAGPGAANVNHAAPTLFGWWGPSLSTGALLEFTDFWRIGVDLGASHHFEREVDDESTGPHTVVSTALEARYAFDVFSYVPYAGLAVGFHPLGAPSATAPDGELMSVRATIGLDYRASRTFSFGTAVALHAPVSQPANFPHYSAARLHVAYHFRLF